MNLHLFHDTMGRKIGHFPNISESAQIDLAVYALGAVIKAGKFFPVISASLTSLNVFLAVNDFLANNMGFAVLNSAFAASGLVFLVQTRIAERNHTKLIEFHTE